MFTKEKRSRAMSRRLGSDEEQAERGEIPTKLVATDLQGRKNSYLQYANFHQKKLFFYIKKVCLNIGFFVVFVKFSS